MSDRLFVAVIGERNSGKSTTWYELFGNRVRTSKYPRRLTVNWTDAVKVHLINGSNEERRRRLSEALLPSETEVFVISGSNEEMHKYAHKVLAKVDCRIVLCSVQYVEDSFPRTWNYVFDQGFEIYAQWLNPGFKGTQMVDSLGLVDRLLAHGALVSIRNGRARGAELERRIEEIRQHIHGWAAAHKLLV